MQRRGPHGPQQASGGDRGQNSGRVHAPVHRAGLRAHHHPGHCGRPGHVQGGHLPPLQVQGGYPGPDQRPLLRKPGVVLRPRQASRPERLGKTAPRLPPLSHRPGQAGGRPAGDPPHCKEPQDRPAHAGIHLSGRRSLCGGDDPAGHGRRVPARRDPPPRDRGGAHASDQRVDGYVPRQPGGIRRQAALLRGISGPLRPARAGRGPPGRRAELLRTVGIKKKGGSL